MAKVDLATGEVTVIASRIDTLQKSILILLCACCVQSAVANDYLHVDETVVLARSLPEFDEPTLGVVVGNEFFLVANSHWNRFDAEANLPAELTGPIVLKLSLD